MGLLIDSTALIHAERKKQAPADFIAEVMSRWGDVDLGVSVMSAAELLHGCWRADTPVRRASREEFVESMLGAIPVVPITLEVARIFAEIDARLTTGGRRVPTSDLLIASTALSRGDAIVTGNPRHFSRIAGLKFYQVG